MHVLGPANWWLPAWLNRFLPRLHVEPTDLIIATRPAAAFGTAGTSVPPASARITE
jgi:RND superfamily putative drug exporter